MPFFRPDAAARSSTRSLALILAAALTACGGSGSGGAPSDSPGTGTTGVTLALVSPAIIQAQIVETLPMYNSTITARVSGNLQSLDGKTIYVRLEDPASLYQPDASIVAFSADTYGLRLQGRPLSPAGHLTGVLKIHVSLDAAGAQPLGGSPLDIPYDITVVPGIVPESDAITVEAAFGTAPVIRDIQVTTLAGAPLGAQLEQGGTASWAPTVSVPDGSTIRVAFPAAPPGTYTYTVNALSSYLLASGFEYKLTKPITVTYVVTPSPAPDYLFSPAEVAVTMSQYSGSVLVMYPVLLLNEGVTQTSTQPVVEYLTHPPAADGNPAAQAWLISWRQALHTSGTYSWWSIEQEFSTVSVDWYGNISRLPPGVYTARVGFTLSKAGVEQWVYLPVTLQVTP